jgi:hypothetical protein
MGTFLKIIFLRTSNLFGSIIVIGRIECSNMLLGLFETKPWGYKVGHRL